MAIYGYSIKNDYDKRVKIEGENILCYSPSRLKSSYPELDPKQFREARAYSASEKKPSKNGGPSKFEMKTIGEMKIGSKNIGISAPCSNNSFLYKKVGYVCLDDGSLVTLCVSRIPFLLIMTALTIAIIIAIVLLTSMLTEEKEPVKPLNPLPPVDTNLVPDTGDSGPSPDIPEGVGTVSMIYTLKAEISLSSKEIDMYLRNPKASNHSVAIELYIVYDGERYLAAKSGLIPAGNGLFTMTMSEDAPLLQEGNYEGLYRVLYYDPLTGVQALVQSDIADVAVSVKP